MNFNNDVLRSLDSKIDSLYIAIDDAKDEAESLRHFIFKSRGLLSGNTMPAVMLHRKLLLKLKEDIGRPTTCLKWNEWRDEYRELLNSLDLLSPIFDKLDIY